MSLSATRSLADSIDATRDVLLEPASVKRWLLLAVVAFFAGGGGGFNPTSFSNASTGTTGGQTEPIEDPPTPDEILVAVRDFVAEHVLEVVLALVVLIALWLVLGLIAAIMEFVFVEALRSDAVRIRGFGSAHFGGALRLLGFRIALGLVTWGSVALAAYYLYLNFDSVEAIPADVVAPLVLALAGVFVLVSIVGWVTRALVVPVMIVQDLGVLAGWRRLLPVLVSEWREYLVYGVLAAVVAAALGIAAGVVVAFLAALLAVPFLLLGALVYFTGGFAGAAFWTILALIALYLLLLVVLTAVVDVPFATYRRYYDLFVLGDTDRDLDPIPDVRARVRSAEDAAGAA